MPISDDAIEKEINLRLKLRKQKKYKEADEIRRDLEALGVILEDKKDGKTEWRKKI